MHTFTLPRDNSILEQVAVRYAIDWMIFCPKKTIILTNFYVEMIAFRSKAYAAECLSWHLWPTWTLVTEYLLSSCKCMTIHFFKSTNLSRKFRLIIVVTISFDHRGLCQHWRAHLRIVGGSTKWLGSLCSGHWMLAISSKLRAMKTATHRSTELGTSICWLSNNWIFFNHHHIPAKKNFSKDCIYSRNAFESMSGCSFDTHTHTHIASRFM